MDTNLKADQRWGIGVAAFIVVGLMLLITFTPSSKERYYKAAWIASCVANFNGGITEEGCVAYVNHDWKQTYTDHIDQYPAPDYTVSPATGIDYALYAARLKQGN